MGLGGSGTSSPTSASSPPPPFHALESQILPQVLAPHRNMNRLAASGNNDNYQPLVPFAWGSGVPSSTGVPARGATVAPGGGTSGVATPPRGDEEGRLVMPLDSAIRKTTCPIHELHQHQLHTPNRTGGRGGEESSDMEGGTTGDLDVDGGGGGGGGGGVFSPLRVSPVHTVMDDLKYTNFTCNRPPQQVHFIHHFIISLLGVKFSQS